jgi:hypothetical protein
MQSQRAKHKHIVSELSWSHCQLRILCHGVVHFTCNTIPVGVVRGQRARLIYFNA